MSWERPLMTCSLIIKENAFVRHLKGSYSANLCIQHIIGHLSTFPFQANFRNTLVKVPYIESPRMSRDATYYIVYFYSTTIHRLKKKIYEKICVFISYFSLIVFHPEVETFALLPVIVLLEVLSCETELAPLLN